VDFGERHAARLVAEGVLRLDPTDWSVWQLKRRRNGAYVDRSPTRIDHASKDGRRNFHIYLEDGRRLSVGVHRFVWQMTHGDIPPRMTVNHKRGIAHGNGPDNLELLTHSDNHKHRFRELGHKAPAKMNRQLLEGFVRASRQALFEDGDLLPLREALRRFDDYEALLAPITKYARNSRAKKLVLSSRTESS
jgi:hypothetical protein